MAAPQKSESPVAAGQVANQNTHTAIVAPPADGCNAKRIANLKAGLALRGFAVHDCTTGGYFVSRWNLTKFCPALADLESFAAQVGAQA